MIFLGYDKYLRSDVIVGLEPLEEERGPGKRTKVYIEGQMEPIIASRTERTIMRDLVEESEEAISTRECIELLKDIRESVNEIPSMVRQIVREQGNWDLDRLEERLRDVLETSPEQSDES